MAMPAETTHPEADTAALLKRYRAALAKIYGDQIDRVVLFGSRARGDARPDSDYDVAVFLKQLPDFWAVSKRLSQLRLEFMDEANVFFDTKPFAAEVYVQRTPLMHEIRKDGLDL